MQYLQGLTEEQQMIVTTVRDIAKNEIAPRAEAIDREGEYPWDIVNIFREAGILALPIPEEYGGAGASELTCCLVIEEVAKVCGNSGHCLCDNWLGMEPILLGGGEAVKKKYLSQLAANKIAAFCLTETEAGSDISGIQTKAVLKGDNYIINGQKIFITNGGNADVLSVFARTSADRNRGMSVFVMEKGTPGFSIGKKEEQLGMRGTPAYELIFEDCSIPGENIIGQEGEGFKTAMKVFDRSRPFDAVLGVGIAAGALQYAIDYAKERKQFGRAIADFQGLQWMMADMAIQLEAARQLVYKAAVMVDEEDPDKTMFSSMANCFATDVGVKVTNDAMQILGGYGYIKDHPLEQKMRDARLLQIVEGTNQIQRVIVARRLLES
ncbi:MAG: acyl-CoA dehydrogenase [Dehalococcoidia bacterium]|nr:MAG: acyl-CoA dehydrogenase [Dehalococcoidia bacterium]